MSDAPGSTSDDWRRIIQYNLKNKVSIRKCESFLRIGLGEADYKFLECFVSLRILHICSCPAIE